MELKELDGLVETDERIIRVIGPVSNISFRYSLEGKGKFAGLPPLLVCLNNGEPIDSKLSIKCFMPHGDDWDERKIEVVPQKEVEKIGEKETIVRKLFVGKEGDVFRSSLNIANIPFKLNIQGEYKSEDCLLSLENKNCYTLRIVETVTAPTNNLKLVIMLPPEARVLNSEIVSIGGELEGEIDFERYRREQDISFPYRYITEENCVVWYNNGAIKVKKDTPRFLQAHIKFAIKGSWGEFEETIERIFNEKFNPFVNFLLLMTYDTGDSYLPILSLLKEGPKTKRQLMLEVDAQLMYFQTKNVRMLSKSTIESYLPRLKNKGIISEVNGVYHLNKDYIEFIPANELLYSRKIGRRREKK